MCNFFSIITRGDGIPLYINLDERKKDPYNTDFDSHSFIADKFIKEPELKNFDTPKGKCDIVNKYEVDFEFDDDFKITDYRLKIDTINVGDDSELLKKNIEKLLPEFNKIVKYHWWSRFVENPKIEGNLDLRGTPITKLPKDLKVGDNLYLSNTPITELPEGLKVGGYLDLRGTPITKLPEDLTVGGDLFLRDTKITKLPDNLKVGGDLYLRDTKITELPKDLKVGGDLYLSSTPITKLPEDLTVGGSLDLSNTPITELPKNLKVGGWLDLRQTQIKRETFIKPVGVIGNVWFE